MITLKHIILGLIDLMMRAVIRWIQKYCVITKVYSLLRFSKTKKVYKNFQSTSNYEGWKFFLRSRKDEAAFPPGSDPVSITFEIVFLSFVYTVV